MTVTLWPLGRTGSFEQPLTAFPPLLNVTVPVGGAPVTLAVTVAIMVTVWLATGAVGNTSSPVVLSTVTSGVGAELAVDWPALFLAVSCTMIVCPASAAVSA